MAALWTEVAAGYLLKLRRQHRGTRAVSDDKCDPQQAGPLWKEVAAGHLLKPQCLHIMTRAVSDDKYNPQQASPLWKETPTGNLEIVCSEKWFIAACVFLRHTFMKHKTQMCANMLWSLCLLTRTVIVHVCKHVTKCFNIVFNKPRIEAITYIRVCETHCIHIITYSMKHVLVIELRASKARVPKDILLNVVIYILYMIYYILYFIYDIWYIIYYILYIIYIRY